MISRRAFLKAGGLAMFGVGLGGIPSFVTRAANAIKINEAYKKRKILVCIFQRGAMDGLMAVTPYEDRYLTELRPDLMISPVKGKSQPLQILDGRFGLHPGFVGFKELFSEKRLAIVHGMGSPNKTRSHFDAQDYMESGTPFDKGTNSGWLNRASGEMGHDATPFRAVSLTSSLPRSFYGENPTLSIKSLDDFAIRGGSNTGNLRANSLEALYDQTSSDLLKETGKESFEAMKILRDAKGKATPTTSDYPKSDLGNALSQIARLIKMDVGLEIAFAESTGWDTHLNQGSVQGIFARNANDLSRSIIAFWKDIEKHQDDVVVLTMTEFGRTVKQNGTRGTDHGRASCSFIIGNHLDGGIVHGSVPELALENLEDHRDLPVTTDFRSVFNELTSKHLKVTNTGIVFPDWNGKSINLIVG